MKIKEIVTILLQEIEWHLDHSDDVLSANYKNGFIDGIDHALRLLKAADKVREENKMSDIICTCGHKQFDHYAEGLCGYSDCDCQNSPDGVELEIAQAELAQIRADNVIMREALADIRPSYELGTLAFYIAAEAQAKVTHE